MDRKTRLYASAMKFMVDHGILIGTTTVGALALGPEGAAIVGLLNGAASLLITSPWWRNFTTLLISNLQILYPFIRERMHVVNQLLDYIMDLLRRLAQRLGLGGIQSRPMLENSRGNDDDNQRPAC